MRQPLDMAIFVPFVDTDAAMSVFKGLVIIFVIQPVRDLLLWPTGRI